MKEILSSARLKNIRVSPKKVGFVASAIRGKQISYTLSFLENSRRAANIYLIQLIKSAVANAQQKNAQVDLEKLILKTIRVDKAFVLKRLRPRAMGRGSLVRKKNSHIYVELSY